MVIRKGASLPEILGDDEVLVSVGSFPIIVPLGHIYLAPNLPKTYDWLPWNIIGLTLQSANIHSPHLIDIGANVGDTLAHFRRLFDSSATCVEPSQLFFDLLARNTAQFGQVEIHKKLLAPDSLVGRVRFTSSTQTGSSSIAPSAADAHTGDYITFKDILTDRNKPYLIKTDTDGFDCEIVSALLPFLETHNIPLIFFEGPSETQLGTGDFENWVLLCSRLQQRGYDVLLMTNSGFPFVYCEKNEQVMRSAFNSLSISMRNGNSFCHYFDVIATRCSLVGQARMIVDINLIESMIAQVGQYRVI